MASVSIIEDHPQRQHIIDSMLAGETLRSVVSRLNPPVSLSTIQRYRQNILEPALRKANAKLLEKHLVKEDAIATANAQPSPFSRSNHNEIQRDNTRDALVGPLLERISVKQQRREKFYQITEKNEDARGFAAIDAGETRDLELSARLTGALDNGPTINVDARQVLILAPTQDRPALPAPSDDEIIDVG